MTKSLYTLVGMKYRGTEKAVANLSPGETLILRRAPQNEFDPNAIEVWYGMQMLAFIKGTEAAKLAKAMDQRHFSNIVGNFRVTGERWPQVEIDW